MTDEDIDTMAALLKTLRDAPHPHAEAKEETITFRLFHNLKTGHLQERDNSVEL